MSSLRLVFAFALLVLPASAQTPEKLAEKAVKAAVKAGLKDVKAGVKQALADFDADAKAFESLAASTSDPAQALEVLATAWIEAHDSLRLAVTQELIELMDALVAALTDYQAAVQGEPGVAYPDVLLAGSGAGFDLFVAGWRKELAKAETQIGARLAKLRKKLAAKDRDFLVSTRPMVLEDAHAANFDATGFGAFTNQLSQSLAIHLVASLSIVGLGQPAAVVAGGGLHSETTHLSIAGALLTPVSVDVTSDAEGFWSHVEAGVEPGSYVVRATQDSPLLEARASLGVR